MGVRRGPFPLHVNKVLKFLPPQSRYDGQMVLHVTTQNYSKFLIFSFFPSHKHFLGSNEVLIIFEIKYQVPLRKINEIKGVAYLLAATL